MAEPGNDLLRGTLDTLILSTLRGSPRHGYGIARWLEQRSGEALSIEEGSLYPALYRLERQGAIEAEWGTSELGRRAKLYRLTPQGHSALERDTERWLAFSRAVSQVLLAEA
ncbi:MAG TPA: PadR family transcriptional regulator [Thermoanaerobaculia bacterium]|nr:PadR family transcriptional regulator [Thermoanaerobaculia bacterium]